MHSGLLWSDLVVWWGKKKSYVAAQAQQEIMRLQSKLANESSIAKAKPEVVEKEREKLTVQEERIGKLRVRRAELGG